MSQPGFEDKPLVYVTKTNCKQPSEASWDLCRNLCGQSARLGCHWDRAGAGGMETGSAVRGCPWGGRPDQAESWAGHPVARMLTGGHRVEARVETLGVAFMGKVLDLDRGGFLHRSGDLGKKHNHYLHLDFLPVKSVVIRIKRDYLGRIGQGRVVNTSGYAGCTLCVVVLTREYGCVLVKLYFQKQPTGWICSFPTCDLDKIRGVWNLFNK